AMPARTVEWYGFGRGEQIYYRVSGSTATTQPYTATLTTTQVQPQSAHTIFQPGMITITNSSSFQFADLDIWVYDANLNAIPGYGRDQPEPMTLTKNYAPGTYYVAVTKANFANNQPQPPAAGETLSQPVLDFVDASLTSSTLFFSDVSVTISDSAGGSELV